MRRAASSRALATSLAVLAGLSTRLHATVEAISANKVAFHTSLAFIGTTPSYGGAPRSLSIRSCKSDAASAESAATKRANRRPNLQIDTRFEPIAGGRLEDSVGTKPASSRGMESH